MAAGYFFRQEAFFQTDTFSGRSLKYEFYPGGFKGNPNGMSRLGVTRKNSANRLTLFYRRS
jgi:hypothetical protein